MGSEDSTAACAGPCPPDVRFPWTGDETICYLKSVIRKRFADYVIERLLAIRWWDWPIEKITRHVDTLRQGDVARLEND